MACLVHEDCFLNHPLMPLSDESFVDNKHFDIHAPDIAQKIMIRKRASIKSNLTASLCALQSLAKAFSYLNALCNPPGEQNIPRAIFPRLANEMRSRPIGGAPDPQLRWYLNSISTPIVQDCPLPQDVFGNEWKTEDESSMIKMQTYSRWREKPNRKRQERTISPATTTEAGRALSSGIRQREPRENSDFLQIVVLEMNVRREGKLDPKVAGKARMWLPARVPYQKVEREGDIPPRWLPISHDTL